MQSEESDFPICIYDPGEGLKPADGDDSKTTASVEEAII